MEQIRGWFARQRERSKEQKRREISDCFQAKEMGDTFCIVHNGDAICDFPIEATIGEVIRELKKRRETAVKYSGI